MSTYYEYRDMKVMIALELMKRDGWKVYGYYPDNSDPMTDYYDPAYWGGIAEKNGYVLVVDHNSEAKPQEIKEYKSVAFSVSADIQKKIEKLKNMTVERGASEQEEATAKASIEKLLAKQSEESEKRSEYTVTGVIPGHMANPPRCNWHIEKDGIIIAKGNGLLKFSQVHSYFYYDRYREDMLTFKRMSKEEYISENAKELFLHGYYNTESDARKQAEYHYSRMEKDEKLFDKFNQFIGKLDTTSGGLMGSADYEYKKVKVTEYKTEYKAVETESGEIKEGQCIILKSSFNYGCYKGLVYRIHENGEFTDGEKMYFTVKLNRKLTKECNGTASRNNHMFSYSKKRKYPEMDRPRIYCFLRNSGS